MHRELLITAEAICEPDLIATSRKSTEAGAVIRFLGIVRDVESGETIEGIDYESFQAMAEKQFHLLFDEIQRKWPITSIRLVHRVGRVKAGDPSLWIEVKAPHRREAFEACEWLIDRMKQKVPIWKKPF